MRFLAPLIPLFFLFLFSYAQTGSTGIPPNESRTIGKSLPDVVLTDAEGNTFPLHSLKGKLVVLSPIYTHCTSACPLITRSLKKVVLESDDIGKDFYVLTLTFDPNDSLEDIKRFKSKHGLELEGWKVVMVKDKNSLFELLDAVDFRFVTLPNREFVHPNLIVLLDQNMVVRKYMYGVSFDKFEFINAIRLTKGDVALPDRFRGYMFLLGMLGAVGTLVYLVVKLTKVGYSRNITA